MIRPLSIILILLVLLSLTGCTPNGTGSAAGETGKVVSTDAPKVSQTDAATEAPAGTDSSAGPQDIASSPAFKYYLAVTLGMTKDEADKAIGLPAEKAKGEYEPEGSYNYIDGDGNGVYVVYNKDMKAFSKVAVYTKESEAVAPLTSKPVTEDQKKQIKKGTAHADIITLLGGNGVECTLTATEKRPDTPQGSIYRWANADGSFIQIAFDAEDKAQNILFHEK